VSGIVPYRRPKVTGVTIDGPNTAGYPEKERFPGVRDYDDGVSVEKVGSGWRVEVSIADVASTVFPGSTVDLKALRQGFTRYGPSRTKHMLDNWLANTALSLLPGEPRRTITVVIHLDADFCVIASSVQLTQFRSLTRLYLEDVSDISRDPEHKYYQLVRQLVEVSVNLRAQLKKREIDASIDEVVGEKWYLNDKCCGDRVIQSLMILANCQFAEFCIHHKIPIIFRNFNIDTDAYALYSVECAGHSIAQGLGYAHSTSPIRRVIDKVNQDMVRAWLLGLPMPRTLDELSAIASYVNKLVAGLRTTYDRVSGDEDENSET
jgi:ribonuclease R